MSYNGVDSCTYNTIMSYNGIESCTYNTIMSYNGIESCTYNTIMSYNGVESRTCNTIMSNYHTIKYNNTLQGFPTVVNTHRDNRSEDTQEQP